MISDNGRGIVPEFLPHVFDRFRQADSGNTREHGGLGLGSRSVATSSNCMAGTSSRKRWRGQGATFRIKLPLARTREWSTPVLRRNVRAPESGVDAALPSLHVGVLAVDDDGDALALIREILAGAGARVTALPSANELPTALQTTVPDVLLAESACPAATALN
jgi:hypothetical protein